MNKGDKINGFTVSRIRPVENLEAEMIEMIHDKTGARLCWLKSNEENKVFSIGFKTTPSDDTGVFHILEHSVLEGSEKYPVKEPFLELLKSSMNTFLNAMTFPDKTIFPVSSRNERDFLNLTKVYLDGVFCPLIYKNPCIFYQEGWHIEWRNKEDEPVYKGVVFNEMKGAFSSVDSRIESEIQQMLLPDTCYSSESGGDPVSIPDLSYEQFLAYHKKFYHPSNSYIYLDGDINIEPVLELIDSYISGYDKSDEEITIADQPQIDHAVRNSYYDIAPETDTDKKTICTIGKVVGSWRDREKLIACRMLNRVLCETNDSPIKRALLDTGLCLDVEIDLMDGINQPFNVLTIRNTNKEDCPELLRVLKETVSGLVKNGIDRESLSAALNRIEFKYREGTEPKGIYRTIEVLSSWLYGGDTLDYLSFDDIFGSLRRKLDEGRYFEEILDEILGSEEGRAELYMIPSPTYGAEQEEKERQKLAELKASWSSEEKAALLKLNQELDEWQGSADTPEQLATLPKLPLSEVSEKPLKLETKETRENGITVLRRSSKGRGISAVNMYFSLADLTEEELYDASLMADFISDLPTEKTGTIALQQRIKSVLGYFSSGIRIFSKKEDKDHCSPYLSVHFNFLDSNYSKAMELVCEMLNETVYNNPGLIKEMILQAVDEIKNDIIASGHRYSLSRVKAGLSAESSLAELMGGFENYKKITELSKDIDSKLNGIIESLERLAERIFCRERLIISVTSDEELSVECLGELLPEGEKAGCTEMAYRLEIPEKQGIIIPAGISYSGAVLAERIEDRPEYMVLSNILSLDYLWNEVRVKGGAYGTGANISNIGEAGYYSYRDPSAAASLEICAKASEFIRSYCSENSDLDQYIISTIAKTEPLLSVTAMSVAADENWFRGITEEQREENRRRMLSVTSEKLLSMADKLDKIAYRCIIGPETAIKGLDSDYVIETV